MELTDAQIKQAISDKKITAIILDTSIFEEKKNGFEHGLLARLQQFRRTPVQVDLSDVVLGEVDSHVTQEAETAQASVRSAMKQVGVAWDISTEKRAEAMTSLFGAEEPRDLAKRRIKAFLESTAAVEVKSSGRVDLDKLLAAYFVPTPPFGSSAARKSEFPDALALHALEEWARENELLLLVVSKDKGWLEYCKASAHLVASTDLGSALSFFHQNAEVACARLAERYINGKLLDVERRIESAVEQAIDRIWFVPEADTNYYYDADVDQTELIAVDLKTHRDNPNPFRVVDKPEENVLVVEADVEAQLEVSSSFSFSASDPIDKDQVPIGTASQSGTVMLDMRVLLTFEGDLSKDAELVEVEVETRDKRVRVDYGEVGPDWDDDPADDD